jgi:hypothetical protein
MHLNSRLLACSSRLAPLISHFVTMLVGKLAGTAAVLLPFGTHNAAIETVRCMLTMSSNFYMILSHC